MLDRTWQAGVAMSSTKSWTCPACHLPATTPYCPQCGERPLDPRELSLRGVISQGLHAFTNLDARLLRTVRCLIARPGMLTQLYLKGPRKPFIGPFALFLLANVVFVAMESLSDSHIFSPTLENHLHRQPWSPWAQEQVAQHLLAANTTLAGYAPIFNQAVNTNAQSFVFMMVPPLALLAALVFYRRHRPFVANLAFSLHFHAFVLLLFSAALLVPTVDKWFGGVGLGSQRLDDVLSISLLAVTAFYFYCAVGPVYEVRGGWRVLQAILLAMGAAAVVLGYRFALFLITLHATT